MKVPYINEVAVIGVVKWQKIRYLNSRHLGVRYLSFAEIFLIYD